MLLINDFIRLSLELNLFFLRIMKEHCLFLEAGFTSKDENLAKEGENFKNIFNNLLIETISLSNGVISPEVKHSGEVVSRYTLSAERATMFFTNISIDTNVTEEEENIVPNYGHLNVDGIEPTVRDLNNRIMNATKLLIDYKAKILKDMLNCTIFTTNYPLLVDHIRREARLYHRMIFRLQHGVQFDIAREAVEQQRFWNRIMAEHARFIRGLLDPSEDALIMTANNFGNEFDVLTTKSIALNDNIKNITEEDYRTTRDIRKFKEQGTTELLDSNIRSIIIPLLGDHTLREANHYIRLLENYRQAL